MMINIVKTTPYSDQKMGTAGLRKKTAIAMQENYFENFMQSIFNTIPALDTKSFLIGGDGRYYNTIAIQKIIKIAIANGVKKLYIGQNGLVSTPAGSHILLKNHLDGGFVLSASHNPGGIDGDFGIKYANASGGQCQPDESAAIYEQTKIITEYKIAVCDDIDLSKLGTMTYENTEIEIIDPYQDYISLMKTIFDFKELKTLLTSNFKFVFDAMHGVTGPYAQKIFEDELGAPHGSILNANPLEDFGGLHPDPNLIYAKSLVDLMYSDNAPDFAAANDGDGDRNMILGNHFFVNPSDCLSILTDNYKLIPAYQKGIFGVAKSAATSSAVKRVAKALNIGFYEVPTGWKYFIHLMDSNRITFCGEESFGTGASHIREKDGIWATLFWLSIIAKTKKTVKEITLEHWQKYGRYYYLRNDYEAIPQDIADKLMADLEQKLPSLVGQTFAGYTISEAHPFIYNDPVDKSSTKNGLIVHFKDGSRIVYRLSGTGTSGATLRTYIERYVTDKLLEEPETMLKELSDVSRTISEVTKYTGKQKPDIIT
ncbi:MAG: alpha-D-glucose phosphate-specific phosphoglucomutase [Alphaproteobacteria bacterium]|nr:alpha-D-glucose phosphate-specific phosphoglucomutase [Alphaproteobacteria bacterium]